MSKNKVVSISFFDEETWNPFKLILRDIAMGLWLSGRSALWGLGTLQQGARNLI